MKKQFRWSLAIITLLSLAGCGLKGPLYFPPAKAFAAQDTVSNMNKAQTKDMSGSGF
ncbi:LPS translocon maturation chaperone LptM [Xenorhabdus szentirmaii]|nr:MULTISPECIES: lipoprotein [Xenorhabdus]MBD2791860.1 lipoprotein [Xenorhabdus sp. CUL]MBD2803769.1 lipoprotein [Xenorhabdus sp. ZM]MBD2819688.1 lipoprotein [Xenorhabdus sp. 42]MBD2823433.1 lipoprotein [Xenorhabdus sp. 5]